MAFTETWLGSSGAVGTAGWNLYGTNGYVRPIYSVVGWTSTQDGLQAVLGSGRPYEARMYTWHGMTAQGTGPFAFAYRAAADGGADTWIETAYMVGVSGDGSSWLYIIDGIQAGTSRTYGWACATQQFGSLSVRFGTTVNAGDWGFKGLTMNVTYGGSGTWHGTWTGTKTVAKAGTYVTLTATLTPGSQGTWFFQNNISAVLLYSDSDSDVTWQNASFTLPYTNTEEDVRLQRLAYVGTWNDGSSVGYLPLGSLLTNCSDIKYYAYMPFEHRAWSPSVTVTLNDVYNPSTSRWLLQHEVLGGGTATNPLGSLVLYGTEDGVKTGYAWRDSRMFSGPINETPAYDYVYRSCEFGAEGALAAYVDKTFDMFAPPWGPIDLQVGTWGPLAGLGTYSIHGPAPVLSRYDLLYVTGSSSSYVTVKDIVEQFTGPAARCLFTVYESAPPSGFCVNASMSIIAAWPTPAAADELRNSPRLLIEKLLANAGLSLATGGVDGLAGSSLAAWEAWADMGVLTNIPRVGPTDKVIDVFNEVCAALGCFYTINPLGAIIMHAPPETVSENLFNAIDAWASPSSFQCEIIPAYGAIDVSYGFDPETGEGPQHSMTVQNGQGPLSGAISSRYMGDAIAGLVAGYRAVRQHEYVVARMAVGRHPGAALSMGISLAARALGYLGHGVSLTTYYTDTGLGWGTHLEGVMVEATYHANDDWLEWIIQRTPAAHPWVCWGSSVPYNGTARWF